MATHVAHRIIARTLSGGIGAGVERVANDVLEALAAHGVELIADLPPVTVTTWDKERLLANEVVRVTATAAQARQYAAAWLAIARHLETRDTEPDPADVDALTSLLAGANQADLSDPRDLARILLLAGVRLPDGGAA
jgi:hypothetical protein